MGILDYVQRRELSVGSPAKVRPFRLYPCFMYSLPARASAFSHACYTEDCVRTFDIISYSFRIYLRFVCMYTSFINSDILTALLLLLRDGYVQNDRLEIDLMYRMGQIL